MTDTASVVERLRRGAADPMLADWAEMPKTVLIQAADEIIRLRALRSTPAARPPAETERGGDWNAALDAVIAAARSEVEELTEACKAETGQIKAAITSTTTGLLSAIVAAQNLRRPGADRG